LKYFLLQGLSIVLQIIEKSGEKYIFLQKFHQPIFGKNYMHNSAKESRADCCCAFC